MSADHRWEFYLDARGLWCWRRLNGGNSVVSDSKRCFPTRDECIADAQKHGFVDRPRRGRHGRGVKWARTRPARQSARRPGVFDPR
ncbi:MAG: hypothetical protein ACM3SS_05185 [Rhodospirillaceae bacterium]